ncbi:hypothetical protein AZE42_07141 [Rhizopogon vesiculosus]|uniref:Uncharacterized protein n=1 Tax=Rhizopogon vesiculosus TaxID=180088 RepID=A0A1J8PKP2_9AGAM|nr:hypothetical protein AZE42_07141 [Rhizopogon vesiculosus]
MPHPADACDAFSHRCLQFLLLQMPAMPSPADACNAMWPMPTSHRYLRCLLLQMPALLGAWDNPTASSSPQCITCRLL